MNLDLTEKKIPHQDAPLIEHVRYYQSIGFYLLQVWWIQDGVCACGRLTCKSPGKHPISENGLNDATNDLDTLVQLWTQLPKANIAVAMEKSGLLGIDCDFYHDDHISLAKAEDLLGEPLPITPATYTGSGKGSSIFLKAPGFPVKGVSFSVVFRSLAFMLLPPSNHISGGRYTHIAGLSFEDIPIASLGPKWLEAIKRTAPGGTAGVPEVEPEWLAKIPREQRMSDVRARMAKEDGETKGESRPGTSFHRLRDYLRGYGIRSMEDALTLAEEYDKKCYPCWGERIGRLVWNVLNKATEPAWGHAYRGEAERNSLPPVPDISVMSALEAVRVKRPSDPQKIQDKKLIIKVLDHQYLGDEAHLVVDTLVRTCPPGTTDAQLINLLMGCNMNDARAEGLVREYRLKHAATVTNIGDLFPEDVVIDGHYLGQSVFAMQRQTDEATSEQPADVALLGKLRLDDEGEPKVTHANMFAIMSEDSRLKGNIRFNLMNKQIEITAAPFDKYDPNTLVTHMLTYFSSKWHIESSKDVMRDHILAVARMNSYNPVADYLLGLKWDGIRRIDTWLIDYCGAQDIEFNRRVGCMWMIGAVARGVAPGSKVDTVLILEGRQGAGKSKTFKHLATPNGQKWFSDSPLIIGNKDSLQMTSFCWIIELAELASLRASETEAQKAFLSASSDKYRPPYGSAPEDFLRSCAFGASTNDVEYLNDGTGNRRFWPVPVGENIDVLRLIADRDQLWAEATYRYLHADLNPHLADEECPGERWWFKTEAEEDMARGVVDRRRPENVWASKFKDWAGTRALTSNANSWTLSELAQQVLGLDIDKAQSKLRTVTKALREAGYENVEIGGRIVWQLSEKLTRYVNDIKILSEQAQIVPPTN